MSVASPPPQPPFPSYPTAPFVTDGGGIALGMIFGWDLLILAIGMVYFCMPRRPLGKGERYARPEEDKLGVYRYASSP